jgi:hypothetical protein
MIQSSLVICRKLGSKQVHLLEVWVKFSFTGLLATKEHKEGQNNLLLDLSFIISHNVKEEVYHLRHTSSPFRLFFRSGLTFCPGCSGTTIFQISASWVAGMIGTCHHTQLLVEMGSSKLFAWSGLKQWCSLAFQRRGKIFFYSV